MAFKPGESGNPSGRPIGSKNKRTELTKLLENHAEELIQILIEQARTGDINALRLCIERILPKATPEPILLDFDIGDINTIEYLMQFGKAILIATANGDISPTNAKQLAILADSHRRLIEHGDLKRKLEEIERAIKINK